MKVEFTTDPPARFIKNGRFDHLGFFWENLFRVQFGFKPSDQFDEGVIKSIMAVHSMEKWAEEDPQDVTIRNELAAAMSHRDDLLRAIAETQGDRQAEALRRICTDRVWKWASLTPPHNSLAPRVSILIHAWLTCIESSGRIPSTGEVERFLEAVKERGDKSLYKPAAAAFDGIVSRTVDLTGTSGKETAEEIKTSRETLWSPYYVKLLFPTNPVRIGRLAKNWGIPLRKGGARK